MTDQEIKNRLARIVSGYTEGTQIDPETLQMGEDTLLLEELGFNSLTLFGILLDVEAAFGITFPVEAFPSLRTAGDVLLAIRKCQADKAVTYEGDGAFFRKESRIPEEEQDALPRPETVCELLEYCSGRYAGRTAISAAERKITYGELPALVRRNCAFLRDRGYAQGDHIGIWSQNDPDAALWILSVMAFGGTAVLLPSALPPEAAAGLAARFDLAGIAAAAPLSQGLRPLLPAVPVWNLEETGAQEGAFGTPAPEQAAVIIFTSGTTGRSRGAVLSHRALMTGMRLGILYPNPGHGTLSDRRYLAAIPVSHIFGLVMGFLSFLYVGGEVCLFPDTMSAIRGMRQVRPTVAIMVPGMVELILSLAKAHGPGFLGGLETVICGGAPIPTELYARAEEYGIEMFGGYGMTEGTGLTSGGAGAACPEGSAGRIYPGVRVRIVDGELWFAGDIVMNGYYKDPEETRKTLIDGWIRSGDLGYVDEEGFVFIRGRVKNLIILPNGENVSPEELETLLYRCPLISECVVKEMKEGEVPVIGALVYPDPEKTKEQGEEQEETTAAIRGYVEELNRQLPSYKRIGKIVFSGEPLSASGAISAKRKIAAAK